MQEKMRIANSNSKHISKTGLTFCLIVIGISTSIAFAQAKSEKGTETTSDEIENLKKQVEQFLLLDQSNPMTRNPHIYYNITADIIQYDGLLDMAERVVTKGIRINTLKNIREAYPGRSRSSIEHQQKLEFSRLYSQHAWILWREGQPEKALDIITKAMSFVSPPAPDDCLRLGIIEYDNGRKEEGWNHIAEALVNDSIVEEQDPKYQKAIDKIVKDKFGKKQDPRVFISEYRKRNAQIIPNISLATLEKVVVESPQSNRQVMLINFFSPICGTCKQEIPSLRDLYNRFLTNRNVTFVFVLTQPDLRQEAISIFKESDIHRPVVAIVRDGSVWDFIQAEPTIWIKDKEGKLVFKHSGYKRGDESIYERKLQKLLGD